MPFPFGSPQAPYPPMPGQSGQNLPYPPASTANPAPMPNTRGDYGGGNNNYNQTGTITEEHIKASLLSAVEDKIRRFVKI